MKEELDRVELRPIQPKSEQILGEEVKKMTLKARASPLSPQIEMEDIYPDSDLKPEGEDTAKATTEDVKEAAAVYLLDILVTLPPTNWRGGSRFVVYRLS
jgi:hypothetical protein